MTPPFRISVVQLTMEPVEDLLRMARVLDEGGFDAFWLGEAYPWWRHHDYEARSSTSIAALIAHQTKRLAVGLGIISPYTRHPIQIAMEARVLQEVAGPDRFFLGLGASRIFMREVAQDGKSGRPLGVMREAIQIVRGVLEGEELDFHGEQFDAVVPELPDAAHAPRGGVPIYVGATGPKMLHLAGQLADGVTTASIGTPRFVRHIREVVGEGAREAGRDPSAFDFGSVIVASIDEDSDKGKEGAREIAGMYLANKVQNIQKAADTLLELADLSREEIQPIADALVSGGRKACAAAVTDEVFRKAKPIAGTPSECIEAIEEYRDAGCTHIQLELWGENRVAQAELFAKKVLPHFKDAA
jgi:5,10-methylenetetrahydromethanopterin reductase